MYKLFEEVKKTILSKKIKNPDTGNMITIASALSYSKNSNVYRTAVNFMKQQDHDLPSWVKRADERAKNKADTLMGLDRDIWNTIDISNADFDAHIPEYHVHVKKSLDDNDIKKVDKDVIDHLETRDGSYMLVNALKTLGIHKTPINESNNITEDNVDGHLRSILSSSEYPLLFKTLKEMDKQIVKVDPKLKDWFPIDNMKDFIGYLYEYAKQFDSYNKNVKVILDLARIIKHDIK